VEAWVDQACHLLNLLSKELQNDFDTFAESFIPVSFPSFHLDTKLLLLCHPMFWLVIMFLCWRHIGLVFIKLVVITVLVIAESADTCIKTVGFSHLSQNFTAKIVHIFSF
jgi:CLIP-associating protein 1/2